MSERDDDARLEREVREVLRRRDPGAAPYGLRERVLDVPATDRRPTGTALRAVVPALGVAAAVLLLAVGVEVAGSLPPPGAAGPSPIASGADAPTPTASFDPMLVGAGIATSAPLPLAPVLLAMTAVVLGLIVVAVHGRRRVVPAAGLAMCVVFGLYASQVPVEVGTYMYGPGLNVVEASMPPGAETPVFYETAAAGEPFSFPLGLSLHAPVAVRIEGVVQPTPYLTVLHLAAVWSDGDPHGSSGPARPFEPVEVSDWAHTLWLVGRAGSCTAGVPVDPDRPPTDLGYTWIDSVTLQATVLGWPRTIEVPLPFRLIEFQVDTCLPPETAPPTSPASP